MYERSIYGIHLRFLQQTICRYASSDPSICHGAPQSWGFGGLYSSLQVVYALGIPRTQSNPGKESYTVYIRHPFANPIFWMLQNTGIRSWCHEALEKATLGSHTNSFIFLVVAKIWPTTETWYYVVVPAEVLVEGANLSSNLPRHDHELSLSHSTFAPPPHSPPELDSCKLSVFWSHVSYSSWWG